MTEYLHLICYNCMISISKIQKIKHLFPFSYSHQVRTQCWVSGYSFIFLWSSVYYHSSMVIPKLEHELKRFFFCTSRIFKYKEVIKNEKTKKKTPFSSLPSLSYTLTQDEPLHSCNKRHRWYSFSTTKCHTTMLQHNRRWCLLQHVLHIHTRCHPRPLRRLAHKLHNPWYQLYKRCDWKAGGSVWQWDRAKLLYIMYKSSARLYKLVKYNHAWFSLDGDCLFFTVFDVWTKGLEIKRCHCFFELVVIMISF